MRLGVNGASGELGRHAVEGRYGMNGALWILQVLLALFSLAAGWNHALRPLNDTIQSSPWAADLPVALVRFVGVTELAAGIGLLLPAATRIKPLLTPLAAVGLAVIMGLAVPFHIMRGEANVIAMHIVVVGLCAVVAWGRFRRVPIRAR
jgi:putative oxidoreductase